MVVRGAPPWCGCVVAAAAVLLVVTGARANDGYLLLAPLRSTSTYLVDRDGRTVHEWPSDATVGMSAELLENGNLLRCECISGVGFEGGGGGGRIREYDWDGNVLWEYVCADAKRRQHHDLARLPNGNVLLIAWERRTKSEALAAGRDPALLVVGELWPDAVLEVRPTPPSGGQVVWEWRAWDHLVQEFDPSRPNYGRIREHPQRIDVNAGASNRGQRQPGSAAARRLRELGYFGVDEPWSPSDVAMCADWSHCNSIDYSAQLDLIVLSSREFSELWFIDHSTSAEQARGSSGGRWRRGGDLVFRWGNPSRWGGDGERVLFHQHDAHWIPAGLPGAGNLLLFNNGAAGLRPWSCAEEWALRFEGSPTSAVAGADFIGAWRSPEFNGFLSGAERLRNGGVLVCAGEAGAAFELAPDGAVLREQRFDPDLAPTRGTPEGLNRWKSLNAVFRAPYYPPDYPGLARLRHAANDKR